MAEWMGIKRECIVLLPIIMLLCSHPYRPYFELKAKYYVQLEVCTFYLFYVEDKYM